MGVIMNHIDFINLVNSDVSLRDIAAKMDISQETVRKNMLKIDAQFPGIFGDRKMNRVFTDEQYDRARELFNAGNTIIEMGRELGLSDAKANLLSSLLRIRDKEIKFIDDENEIEQIQEKNYNMYSRREYKPRPLPDGISAALVFNMVREHRDVTRKQIAKNMKLSIPEFRRLYKQGLKERFPNNGDYKAPFDIYEFIRDKENGMTYKMLAKKYDISIMNACQWKKRLMGNS